MTTTPPAAWATLDQQLAQRETELRALLAAHGAVPASEAAYEEVHDFKDAAGDEAQAVLDDTLSAHASVELAQVLAARRRLADGSYGQCAGCGEPIEPQRLRARPAAALCTACQSERERAHRA